MRELGIGILAMVWLLGSAVGVAAEGEGDGSTPDPSDARARAILGEALQQIAGAQRVSFRIRGAYDVAQPSGHLLEFGAERRVMLRRPDRLRVEVVRRDGHRVALTFDGHTAVLHSPAENTYASAQPGTTVDQALDALVEELRVPVPLVDLLYSDVAAVVPRSIESGLWVGEARVGGDLCDHVAFESPGIGLQVWVSRGVPRLPRRIVITYLLEEGAPQFRADLSEWDLDAELPDAHFFFTPPEGAERLDFMKPRPAESAAEGS